MDGALRPIVPTEDLYEVLGVAPDASADDVRHAYRRKARTVHPDITRGPAAAAAFRRLRDAYEVLGDPSRRRAYDRERAGRRRPMGPSAVHRAPGPTGVVSGPPPRWDVHAPRAEEPRPAAAARIDEWRVMSLLARVAAAVALLAIVVVTAIALTSSASTPDTPIGSTAFCRTPDGWIDCRRVIDPLVP